jgi:hypothetical protein
LDNPNAPWDQVALTTWTEGHHAIRDQDWRYIRYRDGDRELYHNAVDPDEHDNLMSDPGQTDQVERLDQRLEESLGVGASISSNND